MSEIPFDSLALLSGMLVRGTVEEIDQVRASARQVQVSAVVYALGVRSARLSLESSASDTVAAIDVAMSERLTAGAERLSTSATQAGHALDVYAAEVLRIHAGAALARRDADDALTVIRAQCAEIDEIAARIQTPASYPWNVGAPGVMPTPTLEARAVGLLPDERALAVQHLQATFETRWSRAAALWADAITETQRVTRVWAELIEERVAAETRVSGALDMTVVGQLLSISGPGVASHRFAVAAGIAGEIRGIPTRSVGLEQLPEMLAGRLEPAEVSRAWRGLVDSGADTDALARTYSFELARLDGLPFAVRDAAGRAALAMAQDPTNPEVLAHAFTRMGFQPGELTFAAFADDLAAVSAAVTRADNARAPGDTVQLVALGRHNGALTAGISLGDLDHAQTVGVLVSGMRSDVHGITDAFDAFARIRAEETNMALVTWVGYRSPGLAEEPLQSRADAGGAELVNFIEGITQHRSTQPIERLVLVGHSYGTNVGAEALRTLTQRYPDKSPVDAFVTLGSAGLKAGTTSADLGVSEIHSTHADGDWLASGVGQHLHVRNELSDGHGMYTPRVDPRGLEGAREFSSEAADAVGGSVTAGTADRGGGLAVTMHNLRFAGAEEDILEVIFGRPDSVAAKDEVGYLHPDASSVIGVTYVLEGSR